MSAVADFDTERFYACLTTRDFGRPLLHYPAVGSTNDTARAAAETGAPSGTVILADTQTAGRGRLARAWFSPPGQGLWFTLVVRPGAAAAEPETAMWLTLLAGVAAALAIRRQTGVPVTLKWPNDLVMAGRKLGGILAESRIDPPGSFRYVLLGLGLNVSQTAGDFPPELAGRASSLAMEGALGGGVDRPALMAAILNHLETEFLALVNEGSSGLLCRYRMLCSTLGQRVTAHAGDLMFDGLATGIASDGSLILRRDATGEEMPLRAGEVTIRPKD